MSDVLADRYALGPLLGRGGMGRVYAGQDTLLDRPVAVKLLADGLGDDDAARLLREARTAARFQHPNAVAVYDVGEHAGRPFVVMELVEGETLADRLRQRGPLPADEVVAVLDAVLAALEAAHAAGLVHRDVKPANVLMPSQGGAKLADFGIAKQVWEPATGHTSTGVVLGTPSYLAPEQAAGQQPTAAVDIYAAGVVAFEALTGKRPFVRPTALATALAHQRDPAPPLGPGVPAKLAAAVRRALAKDPADRFRSAEEMREALARALSPPSPGWASRLRRDGWKAAAAVGMVLIGLALVLGERGGDGQQAAAPPDADAGAGAGAGDEDAGPGAADGGDGPEESEDEGDAPGDDAGPAAEGPATLEDLLARLTADPAWAGERADDLLDDLLEVAREDDEEDRRADARELIRDVAEWLADGEVRRDAAVATVEVLEPVGRPPAGALAPLSATFAALAVRADEGGDKHKDVLAKMDDLMGEDEERKWRQEGEKLLREIDKWRGDGELDPDVADEAAAALAQLLDEQAAGLDHPVRRLLEASQHR